MKTKTTVVGINLYGVDGTATHLWPDMAIHMDIHRLIILCVEGGEAVHTVLDIICKIILMLTRVL